MKKKAVPKEEKIVNSPEMARVKKQIAKLTKAQKARLNRIINE